MDLPEACEPILCDLLCVVLCHEKREIRLEMSVSTWVSEHGYLGMLILRGVTPITTIAFRTYIAHAQMFRLRYHPANIDHIR